MTVGRISILILSPPSDIAWSVVARHWRPDGLIDERRVSCGGRGPDADLDAAVERVPAMVASLIEEARARA